MPEIFLLPRVEIISVLKQLNLKILFILNRGLKISGHAPYRPFLSSLVGIVKKSGKQQAVLISKSGIPKVNITFWGY